MAVKFSKDALSIRQIRPARFWAGCVAGFFTALSLSLLFNYSREILRLLTGINTDLLILSDKELTFFNYFFASLATAFGLSVAVWVWMSNHQHRRRKDHIFKQLASVDALVVFWVVLLALFVLARYFLSFLLVGMECYDNQLKLYEDHWLLVLPMVVLRRAGLPWGWSIGQPSGLSAPSYCVWSWCLYLANQQLPTRSG